MTFCKLSNINIGKYFLKLIDWHFNKDNPLNKIFNWNTIKITYSCTNNISKIIYDYNKNLIEKSLIGNQPTNELLSRRLSHGRNMYFRESGLPSNCFSRQRLARRRWFVWESQLEIGNRYSIIIDTLFPTLYLKTEKLY